jgi:multiple sugar transport system permease protein
MRFQKITGNILKFTLGFVIFIIALFPIWWMFNIVFSPSGVPVSINPRLFPSSLTDGIKNIQTVLAETQFLKAYRNSLIYTVLEILGVLVLCSAGAYEFALFDFPGKKALFYLILLALMIPTAVTLVPTYLLVADLGWLNTFKGLVIPGMASAFGLFMLTQFLEDLPPELLDAAQIDGASHFKTYLNIVLPLSKNSLVTLAILTFISTWGNFIWPLVIATKADSYTVSQIVNTFNDPMSYTTVNVVMTANFLAALLPLIFYVFFQRQIIEGSTMSGLKG